jgi:hypothetical protein
MVDYSTGTPSTTVLVIVLHRKVLYKEYVSMLFRKVFQAIHMHKDIHRMGNRHLPYLPVTFQQFLRIQY